MCHFTDDSIFIGLIFHIDDTGPHTASQSIDNNAPPLHNNDVSDINISKDTDEETPGAFADDNQKEDPVISFNPGYEETENERSYYQPVEQILRPSSSIEAVNLNSWPTSSTDTSPEQHKDKLGNSSKMEHTITGAYFIFK